MEPVLAVQVLLVQLLHLASLFVECVVQSASYPVFFVGEHFQSLLVTLFDSRNLFSLLLLQGVKF